MARTPKYQAAETEMIARIERGDWEVGRRLPNEFELADEFSVSQGTMRRALISLEGMGYLDRKPGRGTLVAAQAAVAAAPSLSPVLLDTNGKPLSLVPFRGRTEIRPATPAEAETMGVKRVAVLERTLKSRGERAALEAVVVPETLIAELDEDAPVELTALLADHGVVPSHIRAEARAEMTDMAQSVALTVDRHTAMLVVRMAAYDGVGQVIARQILRVAVPGAALDHQ